jgi:membrane fusion protein (multidrug efflux system)
LEVTLRYTADVLPIEQADLLPTEISGHLKTVLVDKGDRVKKGELLARIDRSELEDRVRQAEANRQDAQARYENAQASWQRYAELFERGFVARQERDNAEMELRIAEARLENTRAALAATRTHLGYSEIRAPFTGYVARRYLDPGALVSPGGKPILTLMRLDPVRVNVPVLERDVRWIKLELPARLEVDAYPGQIFAGKVTRFAPALDLLTRTLAVEVNIPNPELRLKPGMYGRVSLIAEVHKDVLLLPREAVVPGEDGEHWVYVVREGRAARMPVEVRYEQGNEVEITKGVTLTDRVIVAGADKVEEGLPVEIAGEEV